MYMNWRRFILMTTPRPNRCLPSFCRCSHQINLFLSFFDITLYTLSCYEINHLMSVVGKVCPSELCSAQGILSCPAVLQDHSWSTQKPLQWFNTVTDSRVWLRNMQELQSKAQGVDWKRADIWKQEGNWRGGTSKTIHQMKHSVLYHIQLFKLSFTMLTSYSTTYWAPFIIAHFVLYLIMQRMHSPLH